jgi:hypothetical protein
MCFSLKSNVYQQHMINKGYPTVKDNPCDPSIPKSEPKVNKFNPKSNIN